MVLIAIAMIFASLLQPLARARPLRKMPRDSTMGKLLNKFRSESLRHMAQFVARLRRIALLSSKHVEPSYFSINGDSSCVAR